MFTKSLITVTLLMLGLTAPLAMAETALVHNSDQPSEANQTVALKELWRVGVDGDVFFGEITSVISDDQGNVYILDAEQCQVFVFNGDGEYLRTLLREGDGPGESRSPSDLFLTRDAKVGIAQTSPAQLVFMQRDGIPAGNTRIPALGSENGGLYFLNDAIQMSARAGGDLLVTGGEGAEIDGQWQQKNFVSRFTPEGQEVVRYYEKHRPSGHDAALIETNNYAPEGDLNCVGPDGRVYLATQRNNYQISVFEPLGEPQLTIERAFESRQRTKSERELVEAGYAKHAGRHGSESHYKLEDTAPDIEAMHVSANGLLRVQHSRSYVDQPNGVMLTYDVFGPDGRFLRQEQMVCEGDARRDRLVHLSGNRWVRIAGAFDSQYAELENISADQAGEQYQLEVICYEVSN